MVAMIADPNRVGTDTRHRKTCGMSPNMLFPLQK